MEAYILDWLQLLFRWAHVITGVAWIGASFYFVWLDNSLEKPPRWKRDKGIKGDLWAIHGGGIYEVSKYRLAPEQMPETLHWFKWEAYSTWLTGMMLMTLVFYVGADAYLIDPGVAALTRPQAIAIGLGFLAGGWLLYELLCSTALARNGYVLAAVLMLLAVAMAWGLTHLFSGRGAFIHMGAMIGTIMVGNVFRVIMPSQRALVAAIKSAAEPDPAWGQKAKLRSTHNNYLTLPVLFIMISNHYPMTYAGPHNWLILLAIIAITAYARHYFNLRHRGIQRPAILVIAALAAMVLAWVMLPAPGTRSDPAQAVASDAEIRQIIAERCVSCHSATPADDVFKVAPMGVMLDDLAGIRRWAPRIRARAVVSADMPFLNKTGMTGQERAILGAWIDGPEQAE